MFTNATIQDYGVKQATPVFTFRITFCMGLRVKSLFFFCGQYESDELEKSVYQDYDSDSDVPDELKQDYVDEQTGDVPVKRSVPVLLILWFMTLAFWLGEFLKPRTLSRSSISFLAQDTGWMQLFLFMDFLFLLEQLT